MSWMTLVIWPKFINELSGTSRTTMRLLGQKTHQTQKDKIEEAATP